MYIYDNSSLLSPSKYATEVTSGAENLVHHMLIYLCPPLIDSGNEEPGECENISTPIGKATMLCRAGVLIAAWAIGGEVRNKNYHGYTARA